MRILFVDDHANFGEAIQSGLQQKGHTVDWLKDGRAAHQVLTTTKEHFDIVLLNWTLPKLSGLEVLTRLREKNQITPVILLTAYRAVGDRVAGLNAGADDCVAKPFYLDELCARIRALQRRSIARFNTELTYGDIRLDPASHRVYQRGERIVLSRREFVVLQRLLEQAGCVVPREGLNQLLYGWVNMESNPLEVHICKLRQQFGTRFIRTVRGVGYMIMAAPTRVGRSL